MSTAALLPSILFTNPPCRTFGQLQSSLTTRQTPLAAAMSLMMPSPRPVAHSSPQPSLTLVSALHHTSLVCLRLLQRPPLGPRPPWPTRSHGACLHLCSSQTSRPLGRAVKRLPRAWRSASSCVALSTPAVLVGVPCRNASQARASSSLPPECPGLSSDLLGGLSYSDGFMQHLMVRLLASLISGWVLFPRTLLTSSFSRGLSMQLRHLLLGGLVWTVSAASS